MNLQEQLEKAQMDLLAEKANGQQKDQDKINQLEALEASLLKQIMDEQNQQAHEGRVQDATTEITTYFDTLYVGGKSVREMCSDEEAYQILKLSVSQAFIDQATKNSEVLSQVQTESQVAIKQANDRANELDDQNTGLLQEKHNLTIELKDITSRFEVATNLLKEAPSSEETESLKQEIKRLNAQLELKNKADEPKGDAKSQIDAMVQDRENKKVKITNLRLADPSGINTKDYLATDVLTGDELQIHSNYVKSFKEVTVEEAAQIRAEKKAADEQLANSIPVTQEEGVIPVNPVLPKDEAAAIQPFPEETGHELGKGLQLDGTNVSHEVPEKAEESEVTYVTQKDLQATLITVYAVVDQLAGRVSHLESNVHPMAS